MALRSSVTFGSGSWHDCATSWLSLLAFCTEAGAAQHRAVGETCLKKKSRYSSSIN